MFGGLPPLRGLTLLFLQPPLLPLPLFQAPLLVGEAALVVLSPRLVGPPPRFLLALVGPQPLLVRLAATVLLQLPLAASVLVVQALAFPLAALLLGPALFVRQPPALGLALGLVLLPLGVGLPFGLAALGFLPLPGVVSATLGLAAPGFLLLAGVVSATFGLAALGLQPLLGLVSPTGIVPAVRLDQPGQHQAQNCRPHKPPADSFPAHYFAFLLAVVCPGPGAGRLSTVWRAFLRPIRRCSVGDTRPGDKHYSACRWPPRRREETGWGTSRQSSLS